MATFNSERDSGYVAGVSLAAKQFCIAVISGNRTVTFAGTAGALGVGIIGNKPLAGEAVELLIGPKVKVVLGAIMTAGQKYSTDAVGNAIVAVATHNVLGQIVEGGAIGDIVAATWEPGALLAT